MIPQLEGHITEAQMNAILNIIQTQYRDYVRLTGSPEFNRIFANEYAPHNRQYGVSWAISSAFPSNMVVAENLQVTRLVYGKGHTRPVLSNDGIELLILNKTTDFDATYLQERYNFNSNQFNNNKLFAYIKFSVENRMLIEVKLCLPDETGNVDVEEILLDRAAILALVA